MFPLNTKALDFIYLCFLSIFSFLSFSLNGQDLSKKELKAMESKADWYFDNYQYHRALPIYLKLDSLKPANGELKSRIGKCYLDGDVAFKCLPYFLEAKKLEYKEEALDYYIARAYHLNHKFDTAISLYEESKKMVSNKDYLKSIDRYIENCQNGNELRKSPVKVTIQNIGNNVNSPNPDYAPVISGDEKTLIFTSSRADSYGGSQDAFGNFYDDIYISHYENGQWSAPENIGPPINTAYNDAPISLSVDGQQLFVYQNDSITGSGDIYVSNLKEGQWSKPEKVKGNVNSKHWEPGASLIADENTFFFSSNKPGGYGGTDIYVCHRDQAGKWSEPKNLGPSVNTRFDEDAPFIHPDSKTLYFSSTGHNSIGGYDVFSVFFNRENDSVGVPENVGYPINTADDELYFVWSADGTRGYFSANREDGFGDKDIYVIQRPSVEMNLILMSGKVETMDKASIPASIYVIDNSTNEVVAIYDSTKFSGKYTLTLEPGKNYAISIESEEFLSHSENIHIPVNGFYELKKDVVLHTIDDGGLIVLNNVFFDQGSAELKSESLGELDRYYETLMENPDVFVEIASHAFDYNDHKENVELSQKRAEAVVNYLVNKGVDPENMRAVGYGDRFKIEDDDSEEARLVNTRTELIILDKLKERGKKKIEQGYYDDKLEEGLTDIREIRHESFRPVEIVRDSEKREQLPKEKYLVEKEDDMYFSANAQEMKKVKKIREEVKQGDLMPVIVKGKVLDGETGETMEAKVQLLDSFGNLISETLTNSDGYFELQAYNDIEKKHSISVHKVGYKYDSKDFSLPANTSETIEVVRDLSMLKLKMGGIYSLRNLYFGYNLYVLKKESFPELDKLVKLMKQNSDLHIQVEGHTDSRGSDNFNKKLSQKRCESVVKYLMKNGIDSSRLKAVGYGEDKPLASNDDETEGRELNRRIEFEIVQ